MLTDTQNKHSWNNFWFVPNWPCVVNPLTANLFFSCQAAIVQTETITVITNALLIDTGEG